MRFAGWTGLVCLAAAVLPGVVAGQERQCWLDGVGGYTHSTRFDSLNYIHRASGGIDYRCSDGTRILADSAVVYEYNGTVQLFGRILFEDLDTRLDADSARYFGNVAQLEAWSRVTVTDLHSDAIIEGDSLRYYQASEFRPLDRVLVYGGDPRATFHPPPVPMPPPAPPEAEATDTVEAAVTDSTEAEVPETVEPEPSDSTETEAPGTDEPGTVDTVAAEAPEAPEAESSDTVEAESPDSAEVEAAGADVDRADAPPVDSVSPPPYDIEARRFMIDGRRYFRAAEDVVVSRDSLRAVGDSLDFDQDLGTMSIIGGTRVEQSGFELTAEVVEVTPTTGLSEEILARRNAELVGREMVMNAPAIRMFLDGGEVNRLVAISSLPPIEPEVLDTTGLSPGDAERARALAAAEARADSTDVQPEDSVAQPSAFADEFKLTADSIDVQSPAQLLELVTAVGSARAEAAQEAPAGSEELPEIASRDWMEGSTILAHFVAADSAATGQVMGENRSRLETLTAVGEARSLYRMTPSDTAATEPDGPPALHLVEGNQIRIHMRGREVVKMEVEGQTVGYHLEPLPTGSADAAGGYHRCHARLGGRVARFHGSGPGHHHGCAGHGQSASGYAFLTPTPGPFAPEGPTMSTGVAVAAASTLKGTGLTKIYKKRRVVSEVDIQVRQREIVALLGPNGAGKTTTFYMLVGLIAPDGGRVHLDAASLTGVPMYKRARMGVGYLAQEPSVFRRLTVEQNVMAILETLNIDRDERAERLEELLGELSIGHLRNAKAYSLSGGERRRLEITRALVQRPKFMLLDEPFAGIDPIALHDIQEIVSGLKHRDIGVIISDHNVEQTLEIVDRAYIMHEGRIRVAGTVPELVWNDEVADLYLGPTLTVRMRSRFPRPGA